MLSTFDVTNTADSGPGSLRQAILDSNAATAATNTIEFGIPGSGVRTIVPVAPLPAISTPVLIDGTSQPGYAGVPLIAIEPPATGSPDSLTSSGSKVTLSGLATSGLALGQEYQSSTLVVQSGPLDLGPGGEIVTHRIDTTVPGMFAAQLHAQGLVAVLALLDSKGNVLVQSDGLSADDRDPSIGEYLPQGTYTLITKLTAGAGVYSLTTTLAPATAPFQAVPVGGDPVAIVAGDFTGDGRTDLAVANLGANTVSVLLGNGDGTFQPQVTYPVGSNPRAIVAGDFRGDGHIDLAVANEGSFDAYGNPIPGTSSVSVLLGKGDGTFQSQVTYPVGKWPDAIVAGDFTGDGHLDLAIANDGSNTVSVLLGKGDGTFQPQVTYTVGSNPDAIVAGDFTDDGHLDLAVLNWAFPGNSGSVSVLLGNGDGTFQPQVTYAVGNRVRTRLWRVTLPATVEPTSPSQTSGLTPCRCCWARATGPSSPRSPTPWGMVRKRLWRGTLPATVEPTSPSQTCSMTPCRCCWARATGPSSPRSPTPWARIRPRLWRVTSAATVEPTSPSQTGTANTVSVLLGKGDGTFQPQVTYPVVGSNPDAIVAGDFSGDGRHRPGRRKRER